MRAIMSKWIIQALLPVQSLLVWLLGVHPLIGSLPISLLKEGPKFWHRIAALWKVMTYTIAFLSLMCSKVILQLKLWWKCNTKV